MDPEQVLENVHHVLHDQVAHAVDAIADVETQWSPQELTKRIVRYIYNSAKNEELPRMPGEEAAVKLVADSMHSYNASCGERQWFFDIDLVGAFSAAAWELVKGQRGATFSRIQASVYQKYNEELDTLLLQKAMWDVVSRVFKDDVERSKIFNAVSKTFTSAFDATVTDRRHREDLQRVQGFMSRWISESLTRVWGPMSDSLTETKVIKLFQSMIAPFGEESQFSCVPAVFIEQIGRPPNNWPFVTKEIKSLLARWRGQEAGHGRRQQEGDGPTAKRRRRGKGGRFDAFEGVVCEAVAEPADDGAAEPGEGHPVCTSAEDCIGCPDIPLVRHMLNGEAGDVYCKTCWESFLETNPGLESVEEEEVDEQ